MDLLSEYGEGIKPLDSYEVINSQIDYHGCSSDSIKTVKALMKSLEECGIPAEQGRKVLVSFCVAMGKE